MYVTDEERLSADETVLSDEGLRALGMVAYWAALLEQTLSEAVRDCAGLSTAKTDILVEGKTAGALTAILRKFVVADAPSSDPDDPDPDPAERALTQERLRALDLANLAITRRNQMLHSAMGGAFPEGHVALYTKKWKGTVVHESEIRKVADQLCDAYHAILYVDMRALR